MMNYYTAINIGPIIATFSLARKPREFWASSYIFSHLMKCIVEKVSSKAILLSPARQKEDEKIGVGLYPDRAFFRSETENADIVREVETVVNEFSQSIGVDKDYFNIMLITLVGESDSQAIGELNKHLDYLELNNRAISSTTEFSILNLIKRQYDSPLFELALGKNKFPIGTLAEIASVGLKYRDNQKWRKAREMEVLQDKLNKSIPEEYRIIDEDIFYKHLKTSFPNDFKSYHKYICIVQADGDNMGKVVTALENGDLLNLSSELICFGEKASERIKKYGGVPIYAGGDDLLFIAPVVGQDTNIIGLLGQLDEIYDAVKTKVREYQLRDNEQKSIETSMSYGVSVTYYKFPLYEAWAEARKLLFERAKFVKGKNAIAWKLQKHSGSSFYGAFSKNNEALYSSFLKLIAETVNERMVSAVAHKLRSNAGLLAIWKDQSESHIEIRLTGFFKKIIDFEGKNKQEEEYLQEVKNILYELYKLRYPFQCEQKEDTLIANIYGMLRTAKFVNGEEVNDGE